MLIYKGDIFRPDVTARGPFIFINSVCMFINSVCMSTCEDAVDISSNDNFANILQSNVNLIQSNKVYQVLYADYTLVNIQSGNRNQVDPETLFKHWNIDHKKALKTVKNTTQRDIRRCLHPSLYRSYPTNDCMMCYNRLTHYVFSDTMKYGVVSKR